jgi:hypothetical protein
MLAEVEGVFAGYSAGPTSAALQVAGLTREPRWRCRVGSGLKYLSTDLFGSTD